MPPFDSRIIENLNKVRAKIAILSGKGGVGKSTVSSLLAIALARNSLKVGILDVDIHGPNIPKIFNVQESIFLTEGERIIPVETSLGIKIASVAALGYDKDTAFIWRGPMKLGVIRQFLSEVEWGELDVLLVDTPPGTGDEIMTIAEHLPGLNGCIVVTGPQDIAVLDARKSVAFARKFKIKILGLIENMRDTEAYAMFGKGGGVEAAKELGEHFLGDIGIDPAIARACEHNIEEFTQDLLPSTVIELISREIDA